MLLSDRNVAVLAAAGSRKTESIIDAALALRDGRTLIVTFTNENQRHIVSRIEAKAGHVPPHISVMGWFAFLINQCAKPYQRSLTRAPLVISGLNFVGTRRRSVSKQSPAYFLDSSNQLYRDGVADFVMMLNNATGGSVVKRLERVYSHIFVDEVQDLGGFDLDV